MESTANDHAPRALITGSTSGIGAAFAAQLAGERYRLVLVARSTHNLTKQAQDLSARFGVTAEVLRADLSADEGIAAVAARIDSQRIDLLINNAGYGIETSTLDTPIDDLVAMSTVLQRAPQVLSWHAVRQMRERGRGGVITVASVAAITTMGEYAAAKASATIFAESLAGDLAGTPITVTAVLPGFADTNFHSAMGAEHPDVPSIAWLTAEQVAREALRDARRGKVLSVPSRRYAAAVALSRFLPRAVIHTISREFQGTRNN